MNLKKLSDTYTLSNGVEIPCIGLGTWQMPNGEVTLDAVKSAIDLGYRHIDTAAGYKNEESVGEAIKQSKVPRKDLFVTSKLHNLSHGYEQTLEAFEVTMKKLNMDYLDLYLIHWPNPESVRDSWQEANAGSWKAFEEFYKSGRIRAIGISNFQPHHINALMETAEIAPMVNQIRLCPGDVQAETVKFCRERNILLEAYSPLATGRVFESEELKAIGDKYNKTVAQVCMRWSLEMGFLPLPKTVTPSRMAENADIFDFNLSEEEIEFLTNMAGEFGSFTNPDTITW